MTHNISLIDPGDKFNLNFDLNQPNNEIMFGGVVASSNCQPIIIYNPPSAGGVVCAMQTLHDIILRNPGTEFNINFNAISN